MHLRKTSFSTRRPTFERLEERRLLSVWKQPVDGLFNDPTKWDPPEVPDANDWVDFDKAGAYTVDFSGIDPTNGILTIDNGTVTFDLKAQHYTLTDETRIAENNDATLIVKSDVAGASIDSIDMFVGLAKEGTLRIDNVEWTADFPPVHGTDTALTVGKQGNGHLQVVEGAVLDLAGWEAWIDNGTVVVDNAMMRSSPDLLRSGTVVVGSRQGDATLTIENAGTVINGTAVIGLGGGGNVRVESGGSWQNTALAIADNSPGVENTEGALLVLGGP